MTRGYSKMNHFEELSKVLREIIVEHLKVRITQESSYELEHFLRDRWKVEVETTDKSRSPKKNERKTFSIVFFFFIENVEL